MRVALTLWILFMATLVGTPSSVVAEDYTSFREALDSGAGCKELFRIRNSLDPKAPEIKRINEDLRDVGCFSDSSQGKASGENKGFDYITCARRCDKEDPSQGRQWEQCIGKCQSRLK